MPVLLQRCIVSINVKAAMCFLCQRHTMCPFFYDDVLSISMSDTIPSFQSNVPSISTSNDVSVSQRCVVCQLQIICLQQCVFFLHRQSQNSNKDIVESCAKFQSHAVDVSVFLQRMFSISTSKYKSTILQRFVSTAISVNKTQISN